jgi:hypothetical protein
VSTERAEPSLTGRPGSALPEPRPGGFTANLAFSASWLLFGAAACLLVLAIVLASLGHATAAVILLAAFALGIAFLSVFGIGIDGTGLGLGPRAQRPAPIVSRREDRRELDRMRRELAQIAAERDRQLLALGDAVTAIPTCPSRE